MKAREVTCRILEKTWLAPSVVGLRFEPSRAFSFEEGQFLSIYVPAAAKPLRRIYSLASASDRRSYELCVKHVPGGAGSGYLAALSAGDTFKATVPHGDFIYRTPANRRACFIATGTGIAPFRAMVRSALFREERPAQATLLFGGRNEQDILYAGDFEAAGVEVRHALTEAGPDFTGFRGRVTELLRGLPADWHWSDTDFYLCGNGAMVEEARRLLLNARGVRESAIHGEAYFKQFAALKPAA